MFCTITAGLLLSNVSVASLPCSDFDEVAVVEERVEEPKVQVTSIDHSYVPLPPSQPKKSEIKIDVDCCTAAPFVFGLRSIVENDRTVSFDDRAAKRKESGKTAGSGSTLRYGPAEF